MGWPAVAGAALVGGAVLYNKFSSNGKPTETNHITQISNELYTKSKEQDRHHLSLVSEKELERRSTSIGAEPKSSLTLRDLKDLKNLPKDITLASTKNIGHTTKDILDSTKATTKEIIASTREIVGVPKMSPPSPPPPTVTRSKSPPRLKPPTFSSAPSLRTGITNPPPSAASSLRVPVTKVLVNASMAPSSLMPPPATKKSRAVALAPGHSPLDWAALTANPSAQLRGKDAPPNLAKITPPQLKIQNGRKDKDAWTVYHGKVYNITSYLSFHPGGEGQLMKGAGRDSTKLFEKTHPWVNWDGMLKECMIGILVGEGEADEEDGKLDELD